MPFRKAHGVVGDIVAYSSGKKISLRKIPLPEYRRRSRLFAEDLYDLLDFRKSLSGKQSAGSTSPAEVRKMLHSWTKKLTRR